MVVDGRMFFLPGAAMTGRAVATDGKVGADRRADQAAVVASWQLAQALWVSAAALTRVSS